MTSAKPSELTDVEWQLLQHLSNYAAPFSIDFVYSNYQDSRTGKFVFCKLFYRLAALLYIQYNGPDEQEPSKGKSFYYVLAKKGIKAVEKNTQLGKRDEDLYPDSNERN